VEVITAFLIYLLSTLGRSRDAWFCEKNWFCCILFVCSIILSRVLPVSHSPPDTDTPICLLTSICLVKSIATGAQPGRSSNALSSLGGVSLVYPLPYRKLSVPVPESIISSITGSDATTGTHRTHTRMMSDWK